MITETIRTVRVEMESLSLSPDQITELMAEIEEKRAEASPVTVRITDADINMLKISRLLIRKQLETPHGRINISHQDWSDENLNFSAIQFLIDDLEINRFIAHKILAIGGYVYFEIVRTREYRVFIYDEINHVIDQLRVDVAPTEQEEPTSEENTVDNTQEVIPQRRDAEFLQLLSQFKLFVERDGWRAFWKRGSIQNKLKNDPEEIGKSQLMAFLRGRGLTFEIPSHTFQEIQEGAGFSDVIHIDSMGNKFLVELKMWRGPAYYEEGICALKSYLDHEDLERGYYVIFDSRKRERTTLDILLSRERRTIHVIQIDIVQRPPNE